MLKYIKNNIYNPFYLYSLIWSVVVSLYLLGWSQLYASLSLELLGFFVLTIIVSAIIGYLTSGYFHDVKDTEVHFSKKITIPTLLISAGFILEFIYEGHIPFLDALFKTGYMYIDYTGIPIFHVILITFTQFYSIHSFYKAVKNGNIWLYVNFAICVIFALLLLNRGFLMMIAFACALIIVSNMKLTWVRIFLLGIAIIFVLFIFGALGNFRYGNSWNDSSYIVMYSQLSDNYPSWLPKQFVWPYLYLVSPLGNLNNLVVNSITSFSINDFIVMMIPDFISKRIFPSYNDYVPLVVDYLTVSTGYALPYYHLGTFGLILLFFTQIFLIISSVLMLKNNERYKIAGILMLNIIIVFMFFENTIRYSGISFALVYPLLSKFIIKKEKENMKILITGGAGFIGSNFAHYMVEKYKDYEITVLDSLTYAGNMKTLEKIIKLNNFKFIHGDITDRLFINQLFESKRFDIVVNFAAESHVDRSIENPEIFLKTNILGTQVLMDAALKYNVKRYHQVSTDEVYGDLPLDRPDLFFTENTPIHTSSPYSASKASADLLVGSYHRTFGLPMTISRCSNNYGPYHFPEKLIPLIIMKALKNEKLPVYGNGLNVRDWLHVYDHCTAIDLIIHEGTIGEIYNIGGHNERTNLDVVKTILKELDKSEDLITYVSDRKGHDLRYAIDPSKIESLGWKPKYSFDTGIKQTIRWYLDNQEWVNDIISGEYIRFMEKNYSK